MLVRDRDDRFVRARPGRRCPAGSGSCRGATRRTTTARRTAGRVYQRLIAEGAIPAGYAADDGAALVFRGTELAEVVASRPDARAYRVERGPDGAAVETELPTRYLG